MVAAVIANLSRARVANWADFTLTRLNNLQELRRRYPLGREAGNMHLTGRAMKRKRIAAMFVLAGFVLVAGAALRAQQAPPLLPVEEIIRRFAAKEAEFKQARDNYTYTQTVRVQEFDERGRPGGTFQQTSEIIFSPENKR